MVQKGNRKLFRLVMGSSMFLVKTQENFSFCFQQLFRISARASLVYSRAESVCIHQHYLASKSFVAVREAFSNPYSNKEVLNKTDNKILRHRKWGDNADTYHTLPTQFKSLLEENERICLSQHDGTTAPAKHITTTLLLVFFSEPISGLGLWLSRSPGLRTLEWFLWLLLEESVQSNKSRSREELKHTIDQTAASIVSKTLQSSHGKHLKMRTLALKKVVDFFSVCYNVMNVPAN